MDGEIECRRRDSTEENGRRERKMEAEECGELVHTLIDDWTVWRDTQIVEEFGWTMLDGKMVEEIPLVDVDSRAWSNWLEMQ